MKEKIDNWTLTNKNDCALPAHLDPNICAHITTSVLEALHKLAKYRESLYDEKKRFEILNRVRIDEDIFISSYFNYFGFPHILEHSTLDFYHDEEWGEISLHVEDGKLDILKPCFDHASLDIFSVEKGVRNEIQVRSLITGETTPLHHSYFDLPIQIGDYFIGRIFRTPIVNFTTFPHILHKKEAEEYASVLIDAFENTEKSSDKNWLSFLKGRGAILMLTFIVEDINHLLRGDPELPNLSFPKLRNLQSEFQMLSKIASKEKDKYIYEGFTASGQMFAFILRETPELHLYFDAKARNFMNSGGPIEDSHGFISVYWLPRERIQYSRFLGDPEWCISISKRGKNLSHEDIKDEDLDLLSNLIAHVSSKLRATHKFAA